MLIQFALIACAIIVSNNNNNNSSYEVKVEAKIENDFIGDNISRALEEQSPFLFNQGFEKISNERNCYCSMLFTNDAGKIVLNQLCVPGGKKAKLSKANVVSLLKNQGLIIGQEKDNFVVCVEHTAWWADIALKMLPEYPALNCRDGLMYIIIIDHLTKHQGSDMVNTLEQIRKAVAYGAAIHTHNTQANDLGVNSVIDVGVKTYSNKFMRKFGNGKVPSWAQLAILHYKMTQVINNSPKYEQMIIKNHSTGGYTLPIDNDEKDYMFLDGLQLQPPAAFLNQYFNEDIIKATQDYGSPWHAPAKLLKELKKVPGAKRPPLGHVNWKPTRSEMRGHMDEFDRAQSGKIIFDTNSKKCWLNQRRRQTELYHEALITNNPKYNKLNQQGLIEKRTQICTDARVLIAATAAAKQKLRREKLNDVAQEMQEKETNASMEYCEGGRSLSYLFHSIANRQKYLDKQIQSNGIWSAKKGGKVNKSKANDLTGQPLIQHAFSVVKLNNAQKLIEEQKRQLFEAMQSNKKPKQKQNKKPKQKKNKKPKQKQNKNLKKKNNSAIIKKSTRKRSRAKSLPPSPKKSAKKRKVSKKQVSDKTEMSDSDEEKEDEKDKKDEKNRTHSAPPKKQLRLKGGWGNIFGKK